MGSLVNRHVVHMLLEDSPGIHEHVPAKNDELKNIPTINENFQNVDFSNLIKFTLHC